MKVSSDTVVGSDSHAPHTTTSKGQVKLPRSSPITPETLALDKSLLIGRKLLRYFPHHGGAKGQLRSIFLIKMCTSSNILTVG